MAQPQNPTCSIVLAPPETADDDQLDRLLTDQDWQSVRMDDPHLAMAELCLRERAQASRAAWGLPRSEQLVLVLMIDGGETGDDPESHDLVSAVRRYLPTVSVWLYRDENLTSLHAADERGESVAQSSTAVTLPAPKPATTTPAHLGRELRLTEPLTEPAASEMRDSTEANQPDAPDITAEEIRMLLEPQEDEAETT